MTRSWIDGENYAEEVVNGNEVVAEEQFPIFTKILAST